MNDTFHRPELEGDPPELGFIRKPVICIAGADPGFVIKKCPQDIGNLTAAGTIAIGSFVFNAAVFSTVASHLAGHFSLGIAAGGTGLAGYILAADLYTFFRSAHLVSGFEQLAQAGLQVSVPRKVRRMVRKSFGIRIAQSCCVSLAVGVMGSLVFYSQDIAGRMRLDPFGRARPRFNS